MQSHNHQSHPAQPSPQLPGLVPHLLHQGVVLDDDGVFHVAASRVGLAVCLRVPTAAHAAAVEENLKAGRDSAGPRGEVDTVGVAVVSFAEYHSVERSVKLDIDPDAGLLALDLDVLDLGQVGLGGRPDVILLQQWRIYDGLINGLSALTMACLLLLGNPLKGLCLCARATGPPFSCRSTSPPRCSIGR